MRYNLNGLLVILLASVALWATGCSEGDSDSTVESLGIEGNGTLAFDAGLNRWSILTSDYTLDGVKNVDTEATLFITNRDELGLIEPGQVEFTGWATPLTGSKASSAIEMNIRIASLKAIVTEPEPEPVDNSLLAGRLEIVTEGGAAITSKEDYVKATFTMTHTIDDWNLESVTGGIRGRGNSTWLWYPKKPYRIKFDKKQTLMGLAKAKSWVLLAEYRDPTSIMNAYVFELGNLLGLPYTNHNCYVEVVLNGVPQGLYHLTEQVQQNENRVNIDEQGGYLIQLDRDDGPELAPTATDNFWSTRYSMPVCVKNPDAPTPAILTEVKASLAGLENAIAAGNMTEIEKLLDVKSMIDFLIIQELIYNVELDAPRSMYMHKNIGNDTWHMGPLWDFDAGFDFNWTNMTTSHDYFASYTELVMGTKPATHTGTQYRIPGFFSDLFKIDAFVTSYKARWKEVKALEEQAWENTYRHYAANTALWEADAAMWPVGKKPATEIDRMQRWLHNRFTYLDTVVAKY